MKQVEHSIPGNYYLRYVYKPSISSVSTFYQHSGNDLHIDATYYSLIMVEYPGADFRDFQIATVKLFELTFEEVIMHIALEHI